MQTVSKPLAKISAGTQETVKLSSGTKYCLFFSNPNVKALNNNCLGIKNCPSVYFKMWVHVSFLGDERTLKIMGGILVGDLRIMHPFGVIMKKPVEAKRREGTGEGRTWD